jgi:hypothetical protein
VVLTSLEDVKVESSLLRSDSLFIRLDGLAGWVPDIVARRGPTLVLA